MSEPPAAPTGPDLGRGVPASSLAEGVMLLGHVGGEPVILARSGGVLHAVGALCTHYHALLSDGLLADGVVHCPWHHARFCLKTGEALGAPAIEPLTCWRVEDEAGTIFVRHVSAAPSPGAHARRPDAPRRIVVIGGGGAGFAAAERLRREGYDGELTLLSADVDAPYDRPNCSKDYLAGAAPREWMPLKDAAYYADNAIDLRTSTAVRSLDLSGRTVTLLDGADLAFDALILATGAAPVRPPVPGFDRPNVYILRSLADCETIIQAASHSRRVAIIGASFIGLEVAAALIDRKLDVAVIAPEAIPLAKILGEDIGRAVQALHESEGVVFYLGRTAVGFPDGSVVLDDGTAVPADMVVLGVGVRPETGLAMIAGLAVDHGVIVGADLQTAAPGVFAVGDVARYPDPRSPGVLIHVEHWAAAQRQGQHAARVILGQADRFTDPPFFWSAHYDMVISYVGHAEGFDTARVDGDIAGGDATVRFTREGRLLAAATLGRDIDSLKIELDFAR